VRAKWSLGEREMTESGCGVSVSYKDEIGERRASLSEERGERYMVCCAPVE